jgi:fructose-1,6-bisphosphatase/inositol monophosphatase family enzyme
MTNLIDKVVAVIKETSDEIILPRFNALTAAEIKEKTGPGDLVTIADVEAENKLTATLKQLVYGSAVVGEESSSKNPTTINLLSGEAPVWVIDPIDGTKNFTRGNQNFCTMVCLVSHNKPLLAVIFDQLNDRYIAAEEGGGAWLHYLQDISAEKLKVMEPVRLDRMSGYLSLGGFRDRATRDEMRHLAADIFKSYDNLGCSGHEYFRLVTDEKHFNINYRTYPWDHLPGCLIHSEAGGYQASFDGKSYLPTELTKGLIAVPNKLVWEEIRKHFLQSYLT